MKVHILFEWSPNFWTLLHYPVDRSEWSGQNIAFQIEDFRFHHRGWAEQTEIEIRALELFLQIATGKCLNYILHGIENTKEVVATYGGEINRCYQGN
ncbi:MAG TPA: hypothetical protein VLE19_13340, partial [Pyrinomonadaceae bacterium]|nr:hypothetical protein [Pyrinomonadaceae bacterium]